MISQCLAFGLLLASSSGFRLEQFTTTTDYDEFFDIVLGSLQSSFPAYVSGPPLVLDITQTGHNTTSHGVGSFSAPYSSFGNFSSLKRKSPVSYSLAPGTLTLSTNLIFDELAVLYPQSTIVILGQNFEVDVKVTVTNNLFLFTFLISSDADGKCKVTIQEAKFTTISNVNSAITSRGFFNQFNMKGGINYLYQTVLDQFNSTNVGYLGEILQGVICSQVAP